MPNRKLPCVENMQPLSPIVLSFRFFQKRVAEVAGRQWTLNANNYRLQCGQYGRHCMRFQGRKDETCLTQASCKGKSASSLLDDWMRCSSTKHRLITSLDTSRGQELQEHLTLSLPCMFFRPTFPPIPRPDHTTIRSHHMLTL